MKISIMMKLLAMMLVLTLIPLGIMGYLALQDEKAIGANAVTNAQNMGTVATEESTKALNALGEQMIQQKSQDVAKQLDLYIRDHPSMTVVQLQADPAFSALAVQPVGKTGYTTVMDAKTLINRFHSNPKSVGTDYNTMATSNPAFYAILLKGGDNLDSSGYYDWKDTDGIMKPKFAYYSVLPTATADGVRFRVGATTWISEFSAPAKEMQQKLDASTQKTVTDIKTSTESMGSSNTVLMITLISMIVVVIASIAFATSISRPIVKLTEVADKVSMGRLDEDVDIRTNDEINDLAISFKRMINAFKMMAAMQETVEEK
jgi:HAMP domain-containing protein